MISRIILAPAAAALLLAGCDRNLSGGEVETFPSDIARRGGIDPNAPEERIFGQIDLNDAFDGLANEDGEVPVNRFLWRASLDTLSFLPLASTDPFTGVIATEWASTPDLPDERYKVAAYVTGLTLSPANLRVAVFREVRDGSGRWVTGTVSPETPRQIEDSILVRARQLRIASAE